MRINCPGCAAIYEVPEVQLGAARGLRCARCDRQWRAAGCAPPFSIPPSDAAEPPEIAVVRAASTLLRQSAMRAAPPLPTAEPASVARRLPVWGLGWAASLLLVLGLIGGSAHWRRPIMHAWPPSMRLYAALGAPQTPNRGK